MRENDHKWLAVAEVREDAILTGEIKSITEERQRFYYHRYIFVQEIKLQTETKLIKAKKITPLQKNTQMDLFTIGDVIRIYGHWEGSNFHFNQYQQINTKMG